MSQPSSISSDDSTEHTTNDLIDNVHHDGASCNNMCEESRVSCGLGEYSASTIWSAKDIMISKLNYELWSYLFIDMPLIKYSEYAQYNALYDRTLLFYFPFTCPCPNDKEPFALDKVHCAIAINIDGLSLHYFYHVFWLAYTLSAALFVFIEDSSLISGKGIMRILQRETLWSLAYGVSCIVIELAMSTHFCFTSGATAKNANSIDETECQCDCLILGDGRIYSNSKPKPIWHPRMYPNVKPKQRSTPFLCGNR